VVHIVDSVITTKRRECPIVLDVGFTRDILSGVIANSMLALKITRLNTVDYAKNFHVTCLSINMIQNMDGRVHSRGLDSWHTERKLEQRNTVQ
jgi:hypothetical protein